MNDSILSEILKELKETWGYTTEELNHIRDLILDLCVDLLEDDDLKKKLEKEVKKREIA